MNTIKIYIVITIIILSSIWLITSTLKINHLQNEITYWQNESIKKDSINVINNNLVSKLSLQLKQIKSENSKLNSIINKKNEEIKTQIKIIGVLKDSISNLASLPGETTYIWINDSTSELIRTRKFFYNNNIFDLAGYFEIDSPYRINFNRLYANVDLEINVVETKEHLWKTYVYSYNKNFNTQILETKIIPYKQTIWDKFRFGATCSIGKDIVGIGGSIFYSKIGITSLYTTNGILLGTTYLFK